MKLTMQEGLHKVLRAANFAAQAHEDQRRKNERATPYINHPISVACQLSEAGVSDPDILAAALLHDTVEDTQTTLEDISTHFGDTVERYVREVSDDKSLNKAERKRLQVERAAHASEGAQLIKLADKLDNLSGLLHGDAVPRGWSARRIQGYFGWSFAVCEAILPIESVPMGGKSSPASGHAPMHQLRLNLEELFSSCFRHEGVLYDCIPEDCSREEVLQEYYSDMASKND